ncbi:MAG: hypothetical protein GY807_15380, partial [Gammaproteobacteria bacterium]|nr:hypothetical protein [Gammaproteobacteria bacterium]
CPVLGPHQPGARLDEGQPVAFSRQWVTITKQEHIHLRHQANYWEAQHGCVKKRNSELEQEVILKDAKIKDLQERLFGKKSEKGTTAKSEKGNNTPASSRNRGQQPGSRGHGRTQQAPSLRKREQFDQIMTDASIWERIKLSEVKTNLASGVIRPEKALVGDTTHYHAYSSFETVSHLWPKPIVGKIIKLWKIDLDGSHPVV